MYSNNVEFLINLNDFINDIENHASQINEFRSGCNFQLFKESYEGNFLNRYLIIRKMEFINQIININHNEEEKILEKKAKINVINEIIDLLDNKDLYGKREKNN